MLRGELRQIFEGFDRKLDSIKAMTEIAIDRGIEMPVEAQKQMQEVIKKFQPYGGNIGVLYNILSELGSIPTTMFQNGLLVKAEELKEKLDEIKEREAKSKKD